MSLGREGLQKNLLHPAAVSTKPLKSRVLPGSKRVRGAPPDSSLATGRESGFAVRTHPSHWSLKRAGSLDFSALKGANLTARTDSQQSHIAPW
jgi:hypothetical protein